MADRVSELAKTLRTYWLRDLAREISTVRAVTIQQVVTQPGSGDALELDWLVPQSRQILTTGALSGGGDLSEDRTLTLATPGSLTATSTNSNVAAHTHAIDSTLARSAITVTGSGALGGGGNLTANRTVTLNTPGTLDVATTNDVGTNHTHAVTASSNPGGAAALLKSTPTGGLTLVALAATTSLNSPLLTTTAADMDVAPVGVLKLNPSTYTVLPDGKELRSTTYVSGFAGSGFLLDNNDTYTGKSSLEVDNLSVRGTLSVYELLIHQIRATNGSIIVANTGKISSRSLYAGSEGAANSEYTLNTDPEHGFAVGDLIRAQRFTGTGVYQSNVEVLNVFSATNFRGKLRSGDAPQVGYEFVRLGNVSDASRQGGLYLTADDTGAPFMDIWNGVDAFGDWNTAGIIKLRLGRLDGLFSGTNEYGLYAGSGVTDADSFIRLSSYTNRLNNLPMEWWNSGAKAIDILPATGISLYSSGATLVNLTAADGVKIEAVATVSDLRSYGFKSGVLNVGGLYGYSDTTYGHGIYLLAYDRGVGNPTITIQAYGNTSRAGRVYLSAKNATSAPLINLLGSTTTDGTIEVTATTINLTGGVGVTGNLTSNGATSSLGDGLGTTTALLRLGYNRTDDGAAAIYFTTDNDTYTDYGLRIVRAAAADGTATITHRGTGLMQIMLSEAAAFQLSTSATKRFSILSDGLVGIGNITPTSKLDVDGNVRGLGLFADGEGGGVSGTTGLSNGTTAVSTGTGTVKLAGSTARNSDLWLKFYVGTTAYYVPAWSNIS